MNKDSKGISKKNKNSTTKDNKSHGKIIFKSI